MQRIVVTVVTDLEYCGNYHHQTKAEATIVESAPLEKEHFAQIYKDKLFHYEVVRLGPNRFPAMTFHITDRTMAPITHTTGGLRGTWYSRKGSNEVFCDGDKVSIYGVDIEDITLYTSVTVEAKDEVGLLNQTSGEVFVPVGDHLEKICDMGPKAKFCGAYIPTKGNYFAERIHDHETCNLKRTTIHPINGSIITLPVTGKEVLYMPSQAVHFTLIEEEVYHSECGLVIRKTKDYNFVVTEVKPHLYFNPPQLINSHNFEVRQALNLKLDYLNYFEAVREQRMAQLINKELREQKRNLNEDFLELLATASGNRLTRRSENATHALFLRMNGSIMREIICKLKKYPLADDVGHCTDELAVMDAGRVRYISYPERIISDNYTSTECDPSLCETYELSSGTVVSQCPKTQLSDLKLESIMMNGTSLDAYVALLENNTFQARSAYGQYSGRPTYRKLMTDYEDRATLSHSRNFWPAFLTNGHLDGNKPFDFARAMTASPLGPLGAVMGFLAGGLQELLLFAALGFAAYFIIKKMREKKNTGNPINMNVTLPTGHNHGQPQ